MEFSSRMKDYYDIYYLANKFDFDGKLLTEALQKTFANRGHTFTIEQFRQITEFDKDSSMQKKWNAFIHKIGAKADDYSTVLKTIKVFQEESFIFSIENGEFDKRWSATDGEWV